MAALVRRVRYCRLAALYYPANSHCGEDWNPVKPRFRMLRCFQAGYWIPVCTGMTEWAPPNFVIPALPRKGNP